MIVCCCSPLSLGVLLFFLHVSPIRCLFVNTISHSKVLLFAFFSRTDVSFSNDVGKVEHPSLNDDRWRNKKNNVHIPGTSNVVGRSSGFFFGNPKRLIFRDTLEIWVARRLQVGFTPPPTEDAKKTPGWRLYILESQNQTLRETILKVWCFTRISTKITVPSLKLTEQAPETRPGPKRIWLQSSGTRVNHLFGEKGWHFPSLPKNEGSIHPPIRSKLLQFKWPASFL